MALPACLHFADMYYPRVKAEAARKLSTLGWSQNRAAKALNVSQAMISKYTSKPTELDPLVDRMSRELVRHLETDGDEARWCHAVRSLTADPEAVQDFLEAEQLLLTASPQVMPQIGVNIACLVGNDVLAYPGRIIAANGKWVRPVPPEMGSKGHLATCLRQLHQANPRIRAIANVRGGTDLRDRVKGHCGDMVEGIDFASVLGPGIDAIHDPGGFGIEPCLYIAGETTLDVAKRIIHLEQQ